MTEMQATPTDLPGPAPTEPLVTYDHALNGTDGPWRGILAIVTFVVGFLILSFLLGSIAIVIDLLTGTIEPSSLETGVLTMTPMVMLFNNLSLAALIPLSMLLQRLFFGVRVGTLSSVVGAFRWRWLGRLALVIVPAWIIYVGISFLLEPTAGIRIDGSIIAMLVIVLLTTPLQSAGEEFGARGLLQRSAGSWFRNPVAAFAAGTVVSATLFSIAHFAADAWLIAYYFVFAASASLAARGTGGLEAPVLIHAVNNVLLLVPVALSAEMDKSFDRSEGTGGPFMLVPMALCLAAALFATWWGRRYGLTTRAPRPRKARPQQPPPAPPLLPVTNPFQGPAAPNSQIPAG